MLGVLRRILLHTRRSTEEPKVEVLMKNPVRKMVFAISLVIILTGMSACNSVVGTYSNPNGTIVLDLKSGGKASLTLLGESKPCTYTQEKDQITVDCEGDKTVFTNHDDGSLTGPGAVGVLKKSKA